MLTPRELLQTEFRVSLRGYNRDDVDTFMRKVVASYETLTRKNKELAEQLQRAEEALQALRTEDEKSSALLSEAQKNAFEIKKKAEAQAEQLLREAREQAEQILAEARVKEQEALARVDEIRREELAVRNAWREMLEAALRRLDATAPASQRSSFIVEKSLDEEEVSAVDEAAVTVDGAGDKSDLDPEEASRSEEP